MNARSARRLVPILVGAGGVMLGHLIAYRVAVPPTTERADLLQRTGHGYLHVANELAALAALFGLAALFLGHLTRPRRRPIDVGSLLRSLIAFQVGAFVLMEAVERVASGSPTGTILDGGLLPIGVAVQVVLAVLGAVVLRLVLRIAELVAELVTARPRSHPRVVATWPGDRALPARSILRGTIVLRGPPLPLALP